MSRRIAVLAAVAISVPLTVGVVAFASTTPARPAGKLVPSSGVLLGAYTNLAGAWTSAAVTEAEVESREELLGRRYDIANHFYAWKDAFPTDLERNDVARGRTPLISWAGTNLTAVADGSLDAWITARADAVKALGAPVFVRWNWEMNGNWNPNGGPASNTPGTTDGPAKYVAAWRHIHDIFVRRGATNAVWVWAPNATSVPTDAWNTWDKYYPGDSYVDWVGVSSYNWGNLMSWSKWHSMTATLAGLYSLYSAKKPFMITETSSTESGGDKAAWIAQAQASVPRDFPSIAAVVWFDQNKETNWRIDSSAAALTAFRTLALDPAWNTRAPAPAPATSPSSTTTSAAPAPVVSSPAPVTTSAAPSATTAPAVSSSPAPITTSAAVSPTAVATSTSAPTAGTVSVVWTKTISAVSTTTRALAGATVSGTIYVRARPSQAVAKVEFFLDDPTMSRAPYRTEKWAPYDLAGSTGTTTNGFSASTLAPGSHRLTVRLTASSGAITVAQVSFSR